MDLHVLRCPQYNLIISGKCLSVCDKNIVANVARELMHRNSWNFTFSDILTQIDVEKFLVKIGQKKSL